MKLIRTTSPCSQRVITVLRESEVALDGHEIAALATVSFNTFQNSIRQSLIDAGLIHIAEWRHNTRGPFVPAYRIGKLIGSPAEKPQKLDQLARSRNWKIRSGYNDARKAERRMDRMNSAPSLMAALLGVRTYRCKECGHCITVRDGWSS